MLLFINVRSWYANLLCIIIFMNKAEIHNYARKLNISVAITLLIDKECWVYRKICVVYLIQIFNKYFTQTFCFLFNSIYQRSA